MKFTKRLLVLLLTLALIFSAFPAAALAETAYDFQGLDNSIKMLSPSDISFDEETADIYSNTIHTLVNGDDPVVFRFVMGAGMNNLLDESFIANNMPHIKIYDAALQRVVAEYAQGEGLLHYLGYNKADQYIEVGVDGGVLSAGQYVLVMGKQICGNNVARIIGKDIRFHFTVTAQGQIPVTNILLDRQDPELMVGQVVTLSATVLPDDASDKAVAWASSDPAVVSVDEQGTLTPLTPGEATVTATAGGYAKTLAVTVVSAQGYVSVTSIAFPDDRINLTVDMNAYGAYTTTLAPYVAAPSPADATNKTVTYASDNSAVATYRYYASPVLARLNGIVVSGFGEANITGTAKSGGITTSVRVTTQKGRADVEMADTATLEVGQSVQLPVRINGKQAQPAAMQWSTSNAAVAPVVSSTYVAGNGTITAALPGTATIKGKPVGDVSIVKECQVSVYGIALSRSAAQLGIEGKGIALRSTVYLPQGQSGEVVWSSSDPAVATVDQAGKVTPKAFGACAITAAAGDYTATCAITVAQEDGVIAATAVTLSQATALLQVDGQPIALVANPFPEDTTDETEWSSSDPAVVAVDHNGIITPVAVGTATVTATVGGVHANCAVSVLRSVAGFTLSQTELTLPVGGIKMVYAMMDGEQVRAAWSSADPAIAKVSSNHGEIQGIAVGQTVMTATYQGQSITCSVTVTPSSGYGFQGYDSLGNGNYNTVKLAEPGDISFLEETADAFCNTINAPFAPDEDIVFGLNMSAGMNNYGDGSNFITRNMPIIKVYDATMTEVVAEYAEGEGALLYLDYTGEPDRIIHFGLEAGALPTGNYVLVLGKTLCGNNALKMIGKEIRFDFKVGGDAPVLPGDVNEDGKVTSLDALLALRYSLGAVQLTDSQVAAADMDGDAKVTSFDALRILRLAVA